METAKILDSLRTMEELDIEQGILYCNGEDTYIEILRAYCEDWKESGEYAEELFEKKDWKNYTIAVHGMKSSLYSIGVSRISEMAKQLEFAGKENRIDFIEANHAKLMEAYEVFFTELTANKLLCPDTEEAEQVSEDMKELSEEEFDKRIADMESATYSFDIDVLVKQMDELEQYSYKGNALKIALSPARRKIEMSDYISAVEWITNWKNSI